GSVATPWTRHRHVIVAKGREPRPRRVNPGDDALRHVEASGHAQHGNGQDGDARSHADKKVCRAHRRPAFYRMRASSARVLRFATGLLMRFPVTEHTTT